MPNPPCNETLDAIVPCAKSGNESFESGQLELGFSLRDFWSWSASDLTSNTLRGILAEYLVARALGVAAGVRTEWDAYDVVSRDGIRIEVKSSAYLQTWKQARLSNPCFSVGLKRGWEAETNTYHDVPARNADVYVCALLHHKDKSTVDPMQMNQWTFYVIATRTLNERFPKHKILGLKAIMGAGAVASDFYSLAATVKAVAEAAR